MLCGDLALMKPYNKYSSVEFHTCASAIRCERQPSAPRTPFSRVSLALLFFLFNLLFSTTVFALQIPEKPQSYVNDYARLLSDNARDQIENTLADFEKATSNQVVVAIFPSLEGEALEDFSIRLAEKWKVGSKKYSNGIMLLIFKEDRKIRIEVGYGLEGSLPDMVASQIIRNEITPAFREGNFDKGVADAVQAIIAATRGEYKAGTQGADDPVQKYSGALFILLVFFMVLPLICYIAVFLFCLAVFGFPLGLFIGLTVAFVLFLLRAFFTSLSGQTIRSSGTGFWGGGFGGGGFSGGGFSGGFSGGGGGFGGGGASGGW